MKSLIKIFFVLIIPIVLLSSCQKDKVTTGTGSVTFKVQPNSIINGKSTKSQNTSAAVAIIVTIEKYGGGVVYDKEKIDIIQLNGTYLSKSLSLQSGGYLLTEFLVIDANNQILYASPKKGSKLEYLVNNPLSIYFETQANQESILIPEVINTDSSSLNDLGYVGFSFNDVKSLQFLINVVSKDPDKPIFDLVDSSLIHISTISNLQYKQYTFTLTNAVNHIYLNNDTGQFIINISKKGFISWADTLTKTQLSNFLTTPLQVILVPANGISITYSNVDDNQYYANFTITKKTSKEIDIDEGYGLIQKLNNITYTHEETPYLINCIQMRNNLDDIQSINVYGLIKRRQSEMETIDLQNASQLENLTLQSASVKKLVLNNSTLKNVLFEYSNVPMSFNGCVNLKTIKGNNSPGNFDIQTCDKLNSIEIDNGSTVEFGANPLLTSVSILSRDGSLITEDELNTLVINLLASVELAPRAGSFVAGNIYSNPIFVAPTGAGLVAAKILQNTYNWTFTAPLN